MPRLFWKLIGAFWLTTALILAISIYASFRLADRHSDARQIIDPREVDAILRDIGATEGVAGLQRWITQDNDLPPGQTVYMVDKDGRDLLQRDVPVVLQQRARRVWTRRNHFIERGVENGPWRGRRYPSPLIQLPDGRQLLAIPGPAPLPTFGVLSSAGLRWTVLAIAMFVSLGSFFLLSLSLIRPALRISETVGRLATGDLAARVGADAYSNDEIGQLGRQIDRMAAELETQATQRRELFRNVSHELRAPLARLQIAAELLERNPDKALSQIERIRADVDALENLTSQVLALARAEQAANGNERTPIVEVLTSIARDAAFEAAAKGVELIWHGLTPAAGEHHVDVVAPRLQNMRVATSAALLRSAIENVVRNAIQMTPPGASVQVTTEGDSRLCTLQVSDSGPGVPETELERIFQPFFRLDTNRPGSGIGLAITARVLHQLGGSVMAHNASAGGLVVVLSIPGI